MPHFSPSLPPSLSLKEDGEGRAREVGLSVRVPCPMELIKTQTKKGGGGGGVGGGVVSPMQCSWCGAHKEVFF